MLGGGVSLPGVLGSWWLLSQGWSLWPLSVGLSSLPRLLGLPDTGGDWGVPRALLGAAGTEMLLREGEGGSELEQERPRSSWVSPSSAPSKHQ